MKRVPVRVILVISSILLCECVFRLTPGCIPAMGQL
jgi:hypothetical protein